MRYILEDGKLNVCLRNLVEWRKFHRKRREGKDEADEGPLVRHKEGCSLFIVHKLFPLWSVHGTNGHHQDSGVGRANSVGLKYSKVSTQQVQGRSRESALERGSIPNGWGIDLTTGGGARKIVRSLNPVSTCTIHLPHRHRKARAQTNTQRHQNPAKRGPRGPFDDFNPFS